MEEEVVSFDTAMLAKEKGFNVAIEKFYTTHPERHLTYAEDYRTERLAESNWNNGNGSYPTAATDVECSAPTQSLLQKWLREIDDWPILAYVTPFLSTTGRREQGFVWRRGKLITLNIHSTYEEALEEALQEALKLINK